jgi:L-lactate dehydrogenase complex protein LldG
VADSVNAARAEVLNRIRRANGRTGDAAGAAEAWGAISREYQTRGGLDLAAMLELLEERLVEYDAGVYHATEANVGDVVRQVLATRGVTRCLVPVGLPAEWLAGAEFGIDADLSVAELDGFGAVMTGATLAIAETGTIVLQAVAGQGRRVVTLVPDYHLCVVRTTDVVETVVEATRHLQATCELPTTYFSGPSATADIEMTRIKGVHGPRFLDVILLA